MTRVSRQFKADSLARTARQRVVLVAVISMTGSVFAQPTATPTDEPRPLPSLDELLGLAEAIAGDDALSSADALDRALSGETNQGDPFGAAVELMQRSRDRLESMADAGVATQRLQADALARLDQVIAQAKARQQQSQNSSSSSSQSQQQQQPNQQQAQAPGQQQPGRGDNNGEVFAPGLNGVNTGPNVDSAGAAWGALPDRLRGALLQGVADQYSSLYERLTEKYYERLAEEADR